MARIGRRTQQVGGFFHGLVVFEGEHNHRAFALAGNDHGGVVVADLFHGLGEVGPDGGVAYGVHRIAPVRKSVHVLGLYSQAVNRR